MENRRYALYGLQLNAPLPGGSLPRVECKTVGQQGLADVVEPGVVALNEKWMLIFSLIGFLTCKVGHSRRGFQNTTSRPAWLQTAQ